MIPSISGKTNTELYALAEQYAVAQEHLAASASEDSQHWHFVALKDLLMELARRMVQPPPPYTPSEAEVEAGLAVWFGENVEWGSREKSDMRAVLIAAERARRSCK